MAGSVSTPYHVSTFPFECQANIQLSRGSRGSPLRTWHTMTARNILERQRGRDCRHAPYSPECGQNLCESIKPAKASPKIRLIAACILVSAFSLTSPGAFADGTAKSLVLRRASDAATTAAIAAKPRTFPASRLYSTWRSLAT
jgi:hypothetical protein